MINRQRKSRNLSCTNQFKSSRSLKLLEKLKNYEEYFFQNLVKKRKTECPRYLINSLKNDNQ